MKAIKFDEEKVRNCVEAYKDGHGKYPYLIMSKKTLDLAPVKGRTMFSTITVGNNAYHNSDDDKPKSITIDGTKYISEEELKEVNILYQCKVLIDDALEIGEVYIA